VDPGDESVAISFIEEAIMKRFLIIIPILLFIALAACDSGTPSNDSQATSVIKSLTATMWTATPNTPTPTTLPNQAIIINALNAVLRGSDPLGEALDTKFFVTDIGFSVEGNPPTTKKMLISVECEWVFKPSCTAERTFVVLMHAFEKDEARKKVVDQVPATLETVQVRASYHMGQLGMMEIKWKDLLQFGNGEITGDQLAVRSTRLTP
jgi:hypothetical protein